MTLEIWRKESETAMTSGFSTAFSPQDPNLTGTSASTHKTPSVALIVLNWNGWKDTIRCLVTLYKSTYPNYHIIVVDNGSADGSVTKIVDWALRNRIQTFVIPEEYARRGIFRDFNRYMQLRPNERIILILNKSNYGYAGGMNVGIRFVQITLKPDYILLLNNDTIVDEKALSKLVKTIQSHDKIMVVGPRVDHYLTKEPVPIEQTILPLPFSHFLRKFFKNVAIDEKYLKQEKIYIVNRLDGSCFLVRASLFKKIGMLNEDFFCYWEDTDFFLRVRKQGYYIAIVPNAIIRHKVGSGYAKIRTINPFAAYMVGRNTIHFIRLHYRRVKRFILITGYILFAIYFVAVCLFYFRSIHATKAFLMGIIRGFMGEKGKPKVRTW